MFPESQRVISLVNPVATKSKGRYSRLTASKEFKTNLVTLNQKEYLPSLYLSSGAAAAALPVPTDFWLFITLLKSKICVKVVHPFIILSISVQSVLLPSVLSSLGEWYRYTLNNERMQYSNTNFGFPKSNKQPKICRHSEGSSCCTT